MKMRYIGLCVFVAFLAHGVATGQAFVNSSNAAKQIKRLKQGTLLIKLNTQSQRIDHRLNSGQKKRAQELMDKVEAEHNEIIKAFSDHYTFSDYYFFLSDDSDAVIIEKNYKPLFKIKNAKNTAITSINNPFMLVLGVPPGYSTVDKYKFILHELGSEGIETIIKPMPKVFKTQTKKLFSNKYDFDRAVIRMQERFQKFDAEAHK